jgi:hypothetical protein
MNEIGSDINNENKCIWVSSRGLLKSCERYNKMPISSCRSIDSNIFENLDDNQVIHICSWVTILDFINNYVPILKKINKKIILVTNDSDSNSPMDDGLNDENKNLILDFINSPFCIHWFTQNCNLNNDKVTPMPIGLDYHFYSLVLMPDLSVKFEYATEQEELLNSVKNNSKPFFERENKCYGNFLFSKDAIRYSNERYSCYDNTPSELCFYENYRIERYDTWMNQINYAFVLSPAGGGLDCHRTWEALILGCIPIVRRFNVPHEKIYEDLPVLIVDNWSDITKELLSNTIENFKNKTFKYEKLTLKYWVDKIYSYKYDNYN